MSSPVLITEGPNRIIYVLIRFMQWKYVESFRNGSIRLGLIEKYRTDYEDNYGGRNDPDDHLESLFQPDLVKVTVGGRVVGEIAGPLKIRQNSDAWSYALCMTAVTDRHLNAAGGHWKADRRLLGLGEAAVVITDLAEFQKRLKAGIDKVDWLRSHANSGGRASGLIEYVDFSQHHGNIGPFRKSLKFAYQQEWRLALIDKTESRRSDHLFLEIGDISDISFAMETKKLISEGGRTQLKPE